MRGRAGPSLIPEPRRGEGRRRPVGLGQRVPACPGQGRWPRTCPLAAGTAGHSWAHSAPVGLAAPPPTPCRAQAEWQGRCVGPWCSRALEALLEDLLSWGHCLTGRQDA